MRTYYQWDDGSREDRNIKADHAAGRMPWISFKPQSTRSGGWAAIASGKHDADIRARARRYANLSKPVIVTFNHEPHNDNTGSPADFAKAWSRIHDVMKNETGLKNVMSAPILGEWEFSPINRNGDPGAYPARVRPRPLPLRGHGPLPEQDRRGLRRPPGPYILNWLDKRGHSDKAVGVGETGCTNDFGNPNARHLVDQLLELGRRPLQTGCARSRTTTAPRNNTLGNTWLLSTSPRASWRPSRRASTPRSPASSDRRTHVARLTKGWDHGPGPPSRGR